MNMNELWNNILISVKKSYKDAIKIADADGVTQTCAGSMRTTIEGLVRLFYLKYYRRAFNQNFKLGKSINNEDFRHYFTGAEYSDIDSIRFVGNDQVHFMFGEKISDEDIVKTFKRAVQTLQKKLKVDITSEMQAKNPTNFNAARLLSFGQTFHVRTNVELLNGVLGTNYKAYGKCHKFLTRDHQYDLVMLPEGKIINGWINTFEKFTEFWHENFVGSPNEKLPEHEGLSSPYRAFFKKCGDGEQRSYVFYGVYELLDESTPNHRINRKISETEDFSKYSPPNVPYHKL